MGLLNFFKKKKETRGTFPISRFIPWSSQTPDRGQYNGGQLPQMRRGLALFSSLANSTPLVCMKDGKEVDHYLLDVLKKPARYLSRSEFISKLTEGVILNGNFYCFIESNGDGKITGLLPYPSGSIWCYPTAESGTQGDSADPIQLNRPDGFYYMSEFTDQNQNKITHKHMAQDIWHLKSPWQNQSDLLNGRSLYESYTEVLELAIMGIEVSSKFASSGMIGNLMLSCPATESPEQKKELRDSITDFFQSGLQYLTLPEGSKVERLLTNNPGDLLRFLSSVSSLHLGRLLGIPMSLISREDSLATTQAGMGLKEDFRFFVKTSGRQFLSYISEKLSELTPGYTWEFKIKSVQSSDMRELSMSVGQLVQNQVLTPEEAKDWLALSKDNK